MSNFKVRDKTRFLVRVVSMLAGEAFISFEGNLKHLPLSELPGASVDETDILKRGTIWPKQDFVVVPLDSAAIPRIINALGGTLPRHILHVQIEKRGVLEFAAYDNFHPGCVSVGASVTEEAIASLRENELDV